MQITSASYLNIELENLPNLGGQLICNFDFGEVYSTIPMIADSSNVVSENKIRFVA